MSGPFLISAPVTAVSFLRTQKYYGSAIFFESPARSCRSNHGIMGVLWQPLIVRYILDVGGDNPMFANVIVVVQTLLIVVRFFAKYGN